MLSLDEIVNRLKGIVGPRLVSTNPIDKINYQHTLAYGAYRALPDVIVRVESDPQGKHVLAKILSFANEHRIPIVAKGGWEWESVHRLRAKSCSTCWAWTRSSE